MKPMAFLLFSKPPHHFSTKEHPRYARLSSTTLRLCQRNDTLRSFHSCHTDMKLETRLCSLHCTRPGQPAHSPQYNTSAVFRMPPTAPLKASTADSGFVLSPGPLANPFTSDPSFQRVLSWYLPTETINAVKPRLTRFGDEAISNQVKEWISNAERHPPYVKQYNVWGQRNDPDQLVTSWGWKSAGAWGIDNGLVEPYMTLSANSSPVWLLRNGSALHAGYLGMSTP